MKRNAADPASERKGSRTRQRIVREAAVLFNTRGFAGTSISDVSAATGLEKGGVYNHFDSKDQLALAAFDYAAALVVDGLRAATRAHPRDGFGQLAAMLEVFRHMWDRPFITGGCPLQNTAVEADDTHPALRDRVRDAMNDWIELVEVALRTAQVGGALRATVDIRAVAVTIVAALEGGVMLTRLYGDAGRIDGVIDQLAFYLQQLRAPA